MKRAAEKPSLAAVTTTPVVTHPEMNDDARQMVTYFVSQGDESDVALIQAAISELAEDVLVLRYAVPTEKLTLEDIGNRLASVYFRLSGLEKLANFEYWRRKREAAENGGAS